MCVCVCVLEENVDAATAAAVCIKQDDEDRARTDLFETQDSLSPHTNPHIEHPATWSLVSQHSNKLASFF